jgi:tetratricopeptide (TPR) repeat protein
MMATTIVRRTVIGHDIHGFPIRRVLLPVSAAFLIFSAFSIAQSDPTQFIDLGSSGPQTISRNQLLVPGKAIRAIERARKEIIQGELDSAQREIARALDIDSHFAVAKVLQGAIDLEEKNYASATNLFQQAIGDDPALGGAYAGMAVVLMHQGRFREALPLLDRAEGLSPGAWLVHFAKAWAQLELGNTAAALSQADYAERVAGMDSERRSGASYLRAMVSIHMNDMETAKKLLAEAITRDPASQYAALAKRELERHEPMPAAGR